MPVSTLLREYQDYVMADRLRRAVGGRLVPRGPVLTLALYARKRLERQELAQALVQKRIPLAGLREIDRLTDEMSFGFWHNPSEVAAFLRGAARMGGHPALERTDAFLRLLTPSERLRLGEARALTVANYYLTCLRLAAPGLDAGTLERTFARLDAVHLPMFVDALAHVE